MPSGILEMQRSILTVLQHAKDYSQILMEYSHSHLTQQTKGEKEAFKKREFHWSSYRCCTMNEKGKQNNLFSHQGRKQPTTLLLEDAGHQL